MYPCKGKLTFTNEGDDVKVHDAVESPISTDHRMITFALSLLPPKHPSRKPVVAFDTDWEGLCNQLLDSDLCSYIHTIITNVSLYI